jgi:pimeloyl-ACP methyl ester carboxylesterase
MAQAFVGAEGTILARAWVQAGGKEDGHMTSTTVGAPVGQSHWVTSEEYRIHVWEKRREASNRDDAGPPRVTLLVHGGTYSGAVDYDIQVPAKDASLMDHLAGHGRDVFTFDIRGYGLSDKPEDGFSVTTEGAVRDTEAVVDAILQMRGVDAVDLLGWSWGGAISALYAARHPDRVRRLVLYAGGAGSVPAGNRPAPTEPWVVNSSENITARIEQDVVIADAQEAFLEAALKWNPRSPNGVRRRSAEGRDVRAEPEDIAVPTMIIYGVRDAGYQPERVSDFFARLNTQDKSLVVIPDAGHFLIIQKPRARLFAAVEGFFAEG